MICVIYFSHTQKSVFFMEAFMKAIKTFFKGVKSESKMVRWPSGKNMAKYSFVILMVFFGVYFYGLDLIFTFVKGIVK